MKHRNSNIHLTSLSWAAELVVALAVLKYLSLLPVLLMWICFSYFMSVNFSLTACNVALLYPSDQELFGVGLIKLGVWHLFRSARSSCTTFDWSARMRKFSFFSSSSLFLLFLLILLLLLLLLLSRHPCHPGDRGGEVGFLVVVVTEGPASCKWSSRGDGL